MVCSEITTLLRSWSAGDAETNERLFELVYPDLHRLATCRLAGERPGLSLQATELVSETYLQFIHQRKAHWQNREQFFALASILIRRILVDHAKHRHRLKRGAGALHLSFDYLEIGQAPATIEVLALDCALCELATIHATTARVVELRFFAGLGLKEAATVLGTSRSTVIRRWRFARAWLANRLA